MKFKDTLNMILSEGKDKKLTKDDIRDMVENGEDITKLDVSHIKDFSEMFMDISDFNQDISKWNTKNAVDMSYMFSGCEKFNQNLSKWNVKNVTNMTNMFFECTNFNQNLSKWNVKKVLDMSNMFEGCQSLRQNFNDWDVDSIEDAGRIFANCIKMYFEDIKELPWWFDVESPDDTISEIELNNANAWGAFDDDGPLPDEDDLADWLENEN